MTREEPLHLPLARALRNLHQALMRAEAAGDPALQNPYALLNAVLNDSRFAWLRAMSQLMVAIDERAAAKEFVRPSDLAPYREALERLVGPGPAEPPEFRRRYDELLTLTPAVAAADAALRQELEHLTPAM